jgi:hypothetical protein
MNYKLIYFTNVIAVALLMRLGISIDNILETSALTYALPILLGPLVAVFLLKRLDGSK